MDGTISIDAGDGAVPNHPDAEIVVHDGASHGSSHDGDAWDEEAFRSSLSSVRELLDR